MSDDQVTQDDEKPRFELYIKAASDNTSKGSCPICQKFFMLSYLLAEEQVADFKVYTVQASCPPEAFKSKCSGKQFPVVFGISGKNAQAQSIAELVCDSNDDVEKFFAEINGPYCPLLKYNNVENTLSEKVFADLYKDFNSFLQGTKSADRITQLLKKIDGHLGKIKEERDEDKKDLPMFLNGVKMSYADCALLPKLQHVRIASWHYKNYEIPVELTHLWEYLRNAYDSKVFVETVPTDQDIIMHYQKRLSNFDRKGRLTLQQKTITLDCPSLKKTVPVTTVNGGENGANGEEQEQEQQEGEQQEVEQVAE